MKKIKNLSIFISVIFFACILIGCDISSVEKAFGLDMHSESSSDDNDSSAKVEIEYLDDKKDTPKSDSVKKSDETEASETVSSDDEEIYDQPDLLYDDVEKRYSLNAASDDKITISFAGDVCLTEGCSVLNYIKKHDGNMANSFDEKLLSHMVDSDIFMLNNEFPYSTGGAPLEGKMYTFRADPSSASYLKDIGTDIVSLANNHCYDYGPQALMDTFSTLRNINMPYVGAGENITEASKPAYYTINGKTIAIIGATQIEGYANPETKEATETSPGVLRCLDTTRLKQVIQEAENNSDFVICFVHWGTEKSDLIRDWQKSTATDMVAAGADLIIGAHSHCLQGIDYIDGVPVFYSLGNYLFNSNTQDTCLVTVSLDCTAVDAVDIDTLRFIPCIQSGGQTVEAPESDWARIIKYEQGISYYASIDADGYVKRSETNHNIQNGMNTSPMRDKEQKTEE